MKSPIHTRQTASQEPTDRYLYFTALFKIILLNVIYWSFNFLWGINFICSSKIFDPSGTVSCQLHEHAPNFNKKLCRPNKHIKMSTSIYYSIFSIFYILSIFYSMLFKCVARYLMIINIDILLLLVTSSMTRDIPVWIHNLSSYIITLIDGLCDRRGNAICNMQIMS